MKQSQKRVRIVIADDHAEARVQAAQVLGKGYDVVGTAMNGREALEMAGRLNPDVILLDISMPDMDGFEVTRRLKDTGCRSKVVFLTVWEDPDYVREATALGAAAYVVKSRQATDLLPAISEVLAGRTFVSGTVRM